MTAGAAGPNAADWRVQLADYASSRLKDEEVISCAVRCALVAFLHCWITVLHCSLTHLLNNVIAWRNAFIALLNDCFYYIAQ